MQEVVEYLLENPDVLFMVKEGTASLIGVSSEELKAILEVFLGKAYYQKAIIGSENLKPRYAISASFKVIE